MKVRMNNRLLAINVVGGLLMTGAAITWVKGTLSRPHFEVCDARYDRMLSMRLDKNGSLMDPAEVQASTNGYDRGILENLQVTKLTKGPKIYAMSVNVANQNAKPVIAKEENSIDGTIFPWAPRALKKGLNAACLSYHVKLSDDFDFQAGVTLPGIYGILDGGSYTDENRIDTNILVGADGAAQFRLYAKGAGGVADEAYGLYERSFPRGRWVKVEQEIILNTPGKSDGIVRLWLNDSLELEIKNADLRDKPDLAIAGVSSSITRGRRRSMEMPDAKPASIQVTPFEVRIN